MTDDKKTMKFTGTKRNENLEPIPLGNIGVIGYDSEIHEDDAIEFTYKLPLGAIKRLIRSYFEEIKIIDGSSTYLGTFGSSENRTYYYCRRMLNELKKQLDDKKLDGQKIIDEVFNRSFKKDYEKMDRFHKNHGSNVVEGFKPCNDPLCCKKDNESSKASNNIFRWINEKIIDSPIFWLITEEIIQDEAEQEINRRLTEEELLELFEAQYFDENVDWNRMVMIREAINKLIKGKEVKQNEKT